MSGGLPLPPTAALVSVGDELLRGDVVDGNAAELGEALTAAGVEVVGGWTVPDDADAVLAALRAAVGAAGLVLVTGGLGPTPDDLTRAALAALAGVPLRRDAEVEGRLREELRRRGRAVTPGVLQQADVPAGAEVLPNPAGTAPGLRLRLGTAQVVAVPGVPSEMRAVVAAAVLPGLDGSAEAATTVLRTAGVGESDVAEALRGVLPAETDGGPRVAFLASGGQVRVRLSTSGAGGRERLDEAEARVRAALGDHVYGGDDDTLAGVVVAALRRRGQTLAVAESLSAGAVCAAVADVPGASAVLRGGVVVYATDLKESLAGVDAGVLAEHGPVSAATAEALAVGVSRRLRADHGLALTGVAGPDPQDGHPPGEVHVALADAAGVHAVRLDLPGDRARVRELAVVRALDLLRRRLGNA